MWPHGERRLRDEQRAQHRPRLHVPQQEPPDPLAAVPREEGRDGERQLVVQGPRGWCGVGMGLVGGFGGGGTEGDGGSGGEQARVLVAQEEAQHGGLQVVIVAAFRGRGRGRAPVLRQPPSHIAQRQRQPERQRGCRCGSTLPASVGALPPPLLLRLGIGCCLRLLALSRLCQPQDPAAEVVQAPLSRQTFANLCVCVYRDRKISRPSVLRFNTTAEDPNTEAARTGQTRRSLQRLS